MFLPDNIIALNRKLYNELMDLYNKYVDVKVVYEHILLVSQKYIAYSFYYTSGNTRTIHSETQPADRRLIGLFVLKMLDDEFFDKLYDGYSIDRVPAKRNINRNASGRGIINELIVRNY
jgi:hypothetical protein